MPSALAREVRVQSGPRGMRAVSGPSAPSGMIARLEPPPQHEGPLLDLGRPLIPSLACLSALSAVPAGNCATTGWSRFPWQCQRHRAEPALWIIGRLEVCLGLVFRGTE